MDNETNESVNQTIYDDFVWFKDDPEKLKDTFQLYVTSGFFKMDEIMNAKKKFETDHDVKILP